MRKAFFTMIAMLACVASFAGSPLSVVNSRVALKKFMAEKASAGLVIDWSDAKYDNRKTAAAEFGDDYEFIQTDCADKFIEGFNTKSKGIKLEKGKEDAVYKFIIMIRNLDSFINVMGFGPRTEAKVWGTMKIVDNASGDTIAEINIDEAEDGTDYVRRESFGKTFLLLGARVAKLK